MLERTLPRYEKLDLLILIVGMSGVVDWLEKGVPAVLPECGLSLDEILPPIRERNFPGRPEVWRPHA